MTPSLLQKIELLTLTQLELSQLLEHELTENPVLEEIQEKPEPEAQPEVDPGAETVPEGEERALEEFDYEYFFGEYLAPSQRKFEYESSQEQSSFETFLATSMSLSDHLNWQLNLLEIPQETRDVAVFLIGNIDSDGYLTVSLEEVMATLGVSGVQAETSLEVVQSMDPLGIGSRTLQECMLFQIRHAGLEGSLAETLISDFLPELQLKRYKEIAKQCKCSLEEVAEAMEIVRKCDPRPGQKYSNESPVYIQPDVYIYRSDEGFQISVADDGMPKLRVNRAYRNMLKKAGLSREAKSFIKDKMRSAIELLKSVDQRQQTIFRVCVAIVERQSEFLEKGRLSLKPMLIKDIAEELGVHSSTISRVVSNKYAHTPQGIIELRKFFTVGVEGTDGENVSTIQVKEQIKTIISNETSEKPLSDQKIAKILNSDGIQITRRTVAKYRDQMNIAGSRERKMAVLF
jgi:RNA polymerase sigma-54 factor